jgi:hypothetical protein
MITLPTDDLRAAVDVVGGAGDSRVGHEVHGGRGDVGRPDHAPDRQRAAERGELVAGQRCGQRRVDEPGRDEVDPDGRQFETGTAATLSL